MSKFCPQCGAERHTGGAYCPECGGAYDRASRPAVPFTVESLTPKQGWIDYLLKSWHGNQLIAAAVSLFGIRVYVYWPFTWTDGYRYTHLASWARDVDSIMLASLIPFLFTASAALSLYNWRRGTKKTAWLNVGLIGAAIAFWFFAAEHVMGILVDTASNPYADDFAVGSAFYAIPAVAFTALGLVSPLRRRRYAEELSDPSDRSARDSATPAANDPATEVEG